MKKIILLISFSLIVFHSKSQCFVGDPINVLHYDINLDLSDIEGQTIKGFTAVSIESAVNNLSAIQLYLLKLDIDSISSDSKPIESFEYNDTIITINLESAINLGDQIKITVYYNGSPVMDPSGWGGFYFVSNYAFNLGVGFEDDPHNYGRVWFPCVDNFTDRSTYRKTITTKIDHFAVCGGEHISTIIDEENQKAIHEWFLDNPIPTYLASIAVGKFELFSTVYNSINGEIPVEVYMPMGQVSNAENSFVNILDVLEIFETLFGPYRWNRVGYVAVPHVFGGMEHATNVTLSSAFVNGTLLYEDLLYHELAHSWWGNLVTCSNSGDMWLNEGWAKYSESLYREFLYGRENMLNFRRNAHNTVLRYYHIQDEGFHPLYAMPHELTYSRTVYEKGASVAHALRGYINDDELFFDALKAFIEEYKFNSIDSYILRDFLIDYTEINLIDFFNAHVFSEGFVHYSIDSVNVNEIGSNYDVTVFIKQKLYGKSEFANSNLIEVSFFDNNLNIITKTIEFDGEFGESSFLIPFNPIMVFCDYYEKFSDASIKETKNISATGNSDYGSMYFRAGVQQINQETPNLLRVVHSFVAPDPFKEDIPGLILADNRYWTIDGNFPEGFQTSGTFYYRNNITGSGIYGHLDNYFISNSLDSLRLVFRPNRATDWSIIEDYSHSIGMRTFKIDNLMPGEYALAIYDWNRYQTNHINQFKNNDISIYPNPSNGEIEILLNSNKTAMANLYNISGQLMHSQNLDISQTHHKIDLMHLPSGMYIIKINTDNIVKTDKIIIRK